MKFYSVIALQFHNDLTQIIILWCISNIIIDGEAKRSKN